MGQIMGNNGSSGFGCWFFGSLKGLLKRLLEGPLKVQSPFEMPFKRPFKKSFYKEFLKEPPDGLLKGPFKGRAI